MRLIGSSGSASDPGPYLLSADGLRPILDRNFPRNSSLLTLLVYWRWKYDADISSHAVVSNSTSVSTNIVAYCLQRLG